jgi:putative endonuclease
MQDKTYYIYILANWCNKVLYVGVTNDLQRRVYEHKQKLLKGFTQRYNVDRLVYFEVCSDALVAIEREKQIKSWSREKKNKLVESQNREWVDLYPSILG